MHAKTSIEETSTTTLHLTPRGPFSLDPMRNLACGFLRGTRACAKDGAVKVAFPEDGSFAIVGARISLDESGRVVAEISGARDPARVTDQLARVLALDHDATPFAALAEKDDAIARALSARPGFRPVVAYSPYVMGAWCVLSQRLSMNVAAALQVKMARAFGDVATVDGDEVASFPRPACILGANGFPGISAEKWTRLQTVARAAQDGRLEAKDLLALPYDEARARLMSLRGVGPWTADGILIRGAGPTDVLPITEPTLHAAVQFAYGLSHLPSDDEVARIAEAWRPFRAWVSVLLISQHFRMPKNRDAPRSDRLRAVRGATSRAVRPRRRSAAAASPA